MYRKWLAWLGLLFVLASMCIGTAWAQYWKATHRPVPDVEEMGIWDFVASTVGLTPGQALVISLAALLLGVLLTIPWWRERLRREKVWWVKRDEPLDTPPRVPSGGGGGF